MYCVNYRLRRVFPEICILVSTCCYTYPNWLICISCSEPHFKGCRLLPLLFPSGDMPVRLTVATW